MSHPSSEHWTDRLSEYLDGELAPAEHEACAAHLATCAECAALAGELRAVADRARALPASAPEHDLWAKIEPRLATPVLDVRRLVLRRAPAWRWHLGLGQIAAAAAVLVAVTAGITWMAVQRGGESPAPFVTRGPDSSATGAPLAAVPGSALPPGAAPAAIDRKQGAAAPADFGLVRYDAAIAELEGVLRERRAKLDPGTVQVVERNLAVIDSAIAEARSALAADPASRFLNTHLASTMRRKVDLLRRVNALAGTRI